MKRGFSKALIATAFFFVVFLLAGHVAEAREVQNTQSHGDGRFTVTFNDGYRLEIQDSGAYTDGTLYDRSGTRVTSNREIGYGQYNDIVNIFKSYEDTRVLSGGNGAAAGGNQYALQSDWKSVDYWKQRLMDFALTMWLQLITGMLAVVGWMFDQVTKFALDNSKFAVGSGDGLGSTIEILWMFVRDIANIVIVFSLLYLAIRTIIDGEGFADKKKLASILLAAILINFSLFFTKLAFTLSNDVAVSIREQIKFNGAGQQAGNLADTTLSNNRTHEPSLSEGIAQTLGVPKSINYISDESLLGKGDVNAYQNIQLQYMVMLTFSVLGVSFILIGGAAILLYRFIVFIFLMIGAPFGLVALFVPWLKQHGDRWLGAVKALTILAPVYFLSFYVSMMLLSQIVKLGTVTTDGFIAVLVQMAVQTALIVGTLMVTIMFPVRVSSAGGEFIGKVGGWVNGKIRSGATSALRAPQRAALWGAQRTGQAAAGAAARTGRFLVGNKFAARVGGNTKEKREELQRRARESGGLGGWWAKRRLSTSEGLKNRTYDFRNIKGVGKKLGIGDGIENWNKAVETRSANLEKKRQSEMKKYGYEGLAKTEDGKRAIMVATAERDNHADAVKEAEKEYNTYFRTDTTGWSQANIEAHKAETETRRRALEIAQEHMEELEKEVGKAKNIGLDRQYQDMMKRYTSKARRWASPVEREAYDKIKKDMEKKWKEEGKSKKKKGGGGSGGTT